MSFIQMCPISGVSFIRGSIVDLNLECTLFTETTHSDAVASIVVKWLENWLVWKDFKELARCGECFPRDPIGDL